MCAIVTLSLKATYLSIISKLRTYEKYPRIYTRTKRFCSFTQYALDHYQE